MTIEKEMKREDLVALIRERERKERVRDAASYLLQACHAVSMRFGPSGNYYDSVDPGMRELLDLVETAIDKAVRKETHP